MAIALNDDFDGLTNFSRVKSVGIIVDVCDLLTGELYDHVTSLEAGHADSRTTKLYDRRGQKVLLEDMERIRY